MIYAQILNGFVRNVIVLNDPTLQSVFVNGFDYLVRIDNLTPTPQIMWAYDPVAGFTNPLNV